MAAWNNLFLFPSSCYNLRPFPEDLKTWDEDGAFRSIINSFTTEYPWEQGVRRGYFNKSDYSCKMRKKEKKEQTGKGGKKQT